MGVIPFVPHRRVVFDDVATKIIGEAFDTACKAMHDAGQPDVAYEVVARRIIAAARRGERDVNRLRLNALAALANSRRPAE